MLSSPRMIMWDRASLCRVCGALQHLNENLSISSISNKIHKQQENENKKVGNLVSFITISYVVCWLPFKAWTLYQSYLEDHIHGGYSNEQFTFIWTLVMTLKYCNHIINPTVCFLARNLTSECH